MLKEIKFNHEELKEEISTALKKYEGIKEKRSLAGKESARLRAEQKATAQQASPMTTTPRYP